MKRSGAIRRPANQLNRSETTPNNSSRTAAEDSIMPSLLRRVPTEAGSVDTQSEENWFHDSSDQVGTLARKPVIRRRTNTYNQEMEIQMTSAELSDALFYYMDCEDRQKLWKDFLIWDAHGVCRLIRTLKLWLNLRLPADKVGEFLVDALYKRDHHMNQLVTTMTEKHETYTSIALQVMQYYQLCDVSGRPAWEIINPGDVDRYAGYKPVNRVIPQRRPVQTEASSSNQDVSAENREM